MSRQWTNELCNCFSDCTTCILSFFVPCYTLGKNAEAVGDNCLLCGLTFLIWPVYVYAHTVTRGKIREQKGIEGTCSSDLLLVFFCDRCALAQEAMEVNGPGSNAMARE